MRRPSPIYLKEYFPNSIINETWFDKMPKDLVKYKLYKYLTDFDIVNFEISQNLPRNFLTEFDIESEKKYQDNIEYEDQYYFNLPVDPYMNYMYKYQNIEDFSLVKLDNIESNTKSEEYEYYNEMYEDYIKELDDEVREYKEENEYDNEYNNEYDNEYNNDYEWLEYLDRKYMEYIES